MREFIITPTEEEPPEFSVAGRVFKPLPEPPGGALADLLWAYQGDIKIKAAGLVRFIAACLPDEAADEFDLLIHSKETIVPLALLNDIANWLIVEYSERPSTPSSGLGSGSGTTSATSGDGLALPDSTSPDSAS